MPLGLRAIRPRRLTLMDTARIRRNLPNQHRRYLLEVAKDMAKYPPQEATSYRRTGDLGKGWTAPNAIKVWAEGGQLVNRVPYAVYVEGPWPQSGHSVGERQTRVMRRKRWPSISDVARRTKKKYRNLVITEIAGRPG